MSEVPLYCRWQRSGRVDTLTPKVSWTPSPHTPDPKQNTKTLARKAGGTTVAFGEAFLC